jgi:hypothetical protein
MTMNIQRPDHLFVTSSGDLYDTRKPIWNVMPPLREKFQYHFNDITTLSRLKATLRAGEFSWPGGYRLAFVTQDGGILSFAAVRAEFKNVVWDFQNGASTGWRVVGLLNVDETEEAVYCDHLNIRLNGDVEEDAA